MLLSCALHINKSVPILIQHSKFSWPETMSAPRENASENVFVRNWSVFKSKTKTNTFFVQISEFDWTVAQVLVFSSGFTAISNSPSAVVHWEVVSNTPFHKQSRWLVADTDCENAVSGDFRCLPQHQLWWLACSLCEQWAQLLCASFLGVLKLSATLKPSYYLFKTPQLCLSSKPPCLPWFCSRLTKDTDRQSHTYTASLRWYASGGVDVVVFCCNECFCYQ